MNRPPIPALVAMWAALSIFVFGAITACSSIPNPFAVAETPTQQVYALERTYNIVLEQAVKVVSNPATPPDVVQRIRESEPRVTALVTEMSNALTQYVLAKAALDAGKTDEEKVAIATLNLETWVSQVEASIGNFAALVD